MDEENYDQCGRSAPKSFLFSYNMNSKHDIIDNNESDFAIIGQGCRGPIFGSGFDLCVADKINGVIYSHSNLGHTYTLPVGIKKTDTDESRSFLCGAINFKVLEYEVYSVEIYENQSKDKKNS